MEEYLIQPWDTREGATTPVDWDMHVPPEIDTLAEEVMRHYDMTVSSRTLITSKPDKGGAIWRIETDKGPRSLKLLHRRPERSLFSVGLQEYVVKQGARVPALIPAKDGRMFVEKGGKLWIVTDWIALQPATKVDLVGAQELCYGLGEFHTHTKGYIPPAGAKNSSRLYRWPNYYQKITKKIGWMRETAKAYQDTAASSAILAVVDQYEQQAVEAMNRLQGSAYAKMVAKGEPHWGLVHQDYGWSNGQNGPGGLWVIDLDGVSYDLPFRDLRKLITSTMDDMGVWDVDWMRGMIDAYHQTNPLDAESFEVLLIDMAMPNEFYKHLKEMFFDPITFLNTEAAAILQRVVAADQTKWQALAELANDKSKYPAGAYDQIDVPDIPQKAASSVAWEEKSWTLQSQGENVKTAEKTTASMEPKKRKSDQKNTAVRPDTVPVAEKKTTVSYVKPKKEAKVKTHDEQPTRRQQGTQSIPPVGHVVDTLPYLAAATRKNKPGKSIARTKTRSAGPSTGRKKTAESIRKKRAASSSKTRLNATRTRKALPKKTASKAAGPGRTVSTLRQPSASAGKTHKPSAARRHSYSKVAGPQHRVTQNQLKRPKAKRGVKKSGGLR